MLIFGLHSTSDDWLSDLSNESCPKCKKMAAKSSKNKMQFTHPHPPQTRWRWDRNGIGTGQVWDRNGPGMGQVWDGTI